MKVYIAKFVYRTGGTTYHQVYATRELAKKAQWLGDNKADYYKAGIEEKEVIEK